MKAARLALAVTGGYLAWRAYRWLNRFDLRDKVALVTGGSRGLGLVMARELIARGARVAICARDPVEMAGALRDLVDRGGQVWGHAGDAAVAEQAADIVRSVVSHFGRLDVVINNAGIIQVGPVETMNLADFEAAMSNNFWSAVHVTTAALPHLKSAGGGRIVNISSIGGKVGIPHLAAYCASKFALVGYSQTLRAELAKDGIVVTTVCPGLMRTGSHGHGFFKGDHRAEYTWFSISGSLPFVTMSAESAASKIVNACQRGDAEIILTLPAQAAAMANQIAPSITTACLAAVNQYLLPPSDGAGDAKAAPGFESHSRWAPSLLTRPNELAEQQNNEAPTIWP